MMYLFLLLFIIPIISSQLPSNITSKTQNKQIVNFFKSECNQFNILTDKKREWCKLKPNIIKTISKGTKLGVDECKHQFKNSRWNCTTFSNHSSVFGPIVESKNRENAYIYAILSAGIAYSVTRACSIGLLTECGCDNTIKDKNTRGKWQWGGCSDDIHYGSLFCRSFVDLPENKSSPEGLMNIHNNEAGRRILKVNMELVCKCHGISGSCTIKICWRKLGHFRKIGNELIRRFEGATHVELVKRKNKLRLRPSKRYIKKPSKKDLVYLEESPDYCNKNDSLGILGTHERKCNTSSYGMDGCKLLCCGRGYQTIIREVEDKCNCKFIWCCKVECQKCNVTKEEYVCN